MSVNIRAVSFLNGVILCGLAIALCFPLLYDILYAGSENINIFVPSIVICLFIGFNTILSCKIKEKMSLSRQDIFLIVSCFWVFVSLFSSLPFYLYSGSKLSFIEAIFEATSGITTTGATVYVDVEILPRSLHVWRFMLHFIGGVGIVALSIVALPIMRLGGMQLFLTENSDKTQKLFPRVSQVAGLFVGTYVIVIAVFAIWLQFAGMELFDSVCHSITAISTGGFSTKNSGLVFYNSNYMKFIVALAMLVGGLTFLEIVRCAKNGFRSFYKNQQTRGYLRVIFIISLGTILVSFIGDKENISVKNAIDYFFEILSSLTTTGLTISDSGHSSAIFRTILIIAMIVGSCSGSTTGGIKIFRLQILYAVCKQQIRQLSRPYDVTVPKYEGAKIDSGLLTSVVSFCALFIITIIISILLITMTGNDALNSSLAVLSCVCSSGYCVNFQSLDSIATVILIIDMLIGRLEIIPMFIIFSAVFWKR